jgi:sterol desaturase/sphingolipid hydroxylase (fatty acid hydroxylase superfamily)
MIGIPLGLAYANAGEWLIHKHILHGLGKRRGSFWSFHWHEHHRAARKYDHYDPDYRRSLLGWNAQTKEAIGLVGLGLLHLPLFPVAPFFTGTLCYSLVNYYRVHKRAHLDPTWARAKLPWHYDHHMGPDQDANWCVTRPWFDRILGTRRPYLGTEKEARDRLRRETRRSGEAQGGAGVGEAEVAQAS